MWSYSDYAYEPEDIEGFYRVSVLFTIFITLLKVKIMIKTRKTKVAFFIIIFTHTEPAEIA